MYDKFDINNLSVVKHNDLIDGDYSMGVVEQRIMLTVISKIDSTQELPDNHVFSISVDDIADIFNLGAGGSTYQHLKDACDSLRNKVIYITLPSIKTGKPIKQKTSWVYMVGYVEHESRIEVRIVPELLPYLTKLTKNFTKYKLANVAKFKSIYSYRLYEFLSRWGRGEYTVSIAWLKERLELTDKYERMDRFKADVIDVAVKEINELSDVNISYKQVKKGRSVIALQFNYAIKQNRKKHDPEVDADTHSLSKLKSKNKPQSSQSEKSEMTGCINIDIFQFNDKDKQLAENALAKVPEATQRIILDVFKSALANRDIKSPLRYLNSLVSKSLSGDLDTSAFENKPAPSNHFEKQTRRADKIKQTFAKHTDEIKAKLADDGHIFIQGEGTVSKSEFEALGLIEKVSRKGDKSISLSDLMAKAEEQENLRKEKEIAQKKAKREKQPKTVADIPVATMSEKEIAARQKILELEAQLIAAGEFVGINEKAISEDELAGLAELEAMQANLMKKL
jgi:plasmid replication initiation protein